MAIANLDFPSTVSRMNFDRRSLNFQIVESIDSPSLPFQKSNSIEKRKINDRRQTHTTIGREEEQIVILFGWVVVIERTSFHSSIEIEMHSSTFFRDSAKVTNFSPSSDQMARLFRLHHLSH